MNNLKRIRIEKNMTQIQLANAVNVSLRYIAFIEKGERMPSLSLAAKLASTLDTSIDYIFLPSKCT